MPKSGKVSQPRQSSSDMQNPPGPLTVSSAHGIGPCTELCKETAKFMANRTVACKFVDGWTGKRGTAVYTRQETSKKSKGFFAVKVQGVTGYLLYDLKKDTYKKEWVLLEVRTTLRDCLHCACFNISLTRLFVCRRSAETHLGLAGNSGKLQ